MQDKDFKKLIDGFPEGVFVFQNDDIKYVNPRLATLLGYSQNASNRLKIDKFIHPEYRNTFIRMLDKFQTRKTDSRRMKFKVSAITKEQKQVWLQIHISSINTPDEKYILGQVRKLSEENYQNKNFAEPPDCQQIIMDTIPVQVWYLIDEDTYGSVNQAHAEFYGVDKKDMAFKTLEDIFPSDVAQACKQGNKKVFNTGRPLQNEEWVPNHEDEERLLSINKMPVKNSNGKVEYVVCSAKDITESKKARNKLIRVADWYKSLVEKTSAGIGISDFDENFILVNDSFASMLGYKNEELIGTNLNKIVDKDTYNKFKDKSKKRKKGRSDVYEARIEKKDGTYLDAIIDASPYVDDYGEINGTVAVVHDISPLKQADKLMKAERDMSLKLTGASELDDVVKIVLESAIEGTNMDSGGVYITNQEKELHLIAHQGLSDKFVKAASYYGPDSKNTKLVIQGENIYTGFDKIERDQNQAIENEGLKTFGLIPIKYRNDIIACLNIASHSKKTIPDSTRYYIENLANRMGDSIARAQELEKRKKKQENFDTFFNTISDFLFILDQNGDIIYTNDAVKDKLGYSEEELQEKNVLQVHPPDRREEAGRIVQEMLEGERKFCPVPLITSSGDRIPVETKVVRGEWNGRKALFGISRNISERKEAEEKIRSVKQKLESFTKAIPDLAMILDEDGKYIEVMGSNKDLLYTNEEDLIGKTLGEILPEETSSRMENFIDKIIKSGTNQNIEYSLSLNGQHHDFEARGLPYKDPNTGKTFIALMARDITNRKRMERALQHSEKRFRDLVNLLPQTVFETDLNGKFTFVNRSGVETFGYSKEGLIANMTVMDVVVQEQKGMFQANIDKILNLKEVDQGEKEYRLVRKDGSVFPALIDSATIFRNGEAVGMRGIVVDISRRKKAEEEVKAKYNLQKIVSEIVKGFILRSLDEVDNVVNYSLGRIGGFLNVDRSYVFIFQENGKFMDNTHEWCAKGIEPQIENLKDLPSNTFPWWMEKLNKFENINVPDVEQLPKKAGKEKEILQAQEIKSVFVAPLRVGNSLKGFVGFDAVKQKRTWDEEVARHLHLIGDLIMGALERRDVKQELARSNQRMNLAKNAAGIGIWDIDIGNKDVFWDDQMYNLWGMDKDEDLDLNIYKNKFVKDDISRFEDKINDAIYKDKQLNFEARVKVSENKIRHLKSFGKVIRNESDEPIRMLGVSWDITKTKELEKSLLRSKEEAEKAARSKSIFLGNMSHEIRTPL
ncbi:MAG TPA: PAS domain S-box protein, partial [bacterium]|nr:PAS domain S-box protein [bacterium]